MNSNMVKPENFDHLHLVYHFTVPLKTFKYSSCTIKHIPCIEVQFTCIEVRFRDQNNKALEIGDRIELTLVIKDTVRRSFGMIH